MKTTARVYISAFEVDPTIAVDRSRYHVLSPADVSLFTPAISSRASEREVAVPRLIIAVCARLRASGVDVVWFRDFWDYATIEDTIAGCSAALVGADRYYFSSTGKLIELCYAAGQRAYSRTPIVPIPIFILPIDDSYQGYRNLERPGSWTVLEPDAAAASREIVATVEAGRTTDAKSR